jgi:hypothetical protein
MQMKPLVDVAGSCSAGPRIRGRSAAFRSAGSRMFRVWSQSLALRLIASLLGTSAAALVISWLAGASNPTRIAVTVNGWGLFVRASFGSRLGLPLVSRALEPDFTRSSKPCALDTGKDSPLDFRSLVSGNGKVASTTVTLSLSLSYLLQ